MNILFVHEVDWMEKVVFDIHLLAEALSIRGHQVFAIDYENKWKRRNFFDLGTFITREVKGISRALPEAKVKLIHPGFIKIPGLSRISASLLHYFAINKTIKRNEIDAIILYSVPTNGLHTIYLANKFKIPVLFRCIDVLNMLVPYPRILRPITSFLETKVYSKVDKVLSITPKLSQYVTKKGANPNNIELLSLPVDTALFHPSTDTTQIRKKWGFSAEDDIIVYIGTLFEFSGLDAFLKRFPKVIEKIPAAKLLIVGDGPQRPTLEKVITDMGLSKQVVITGFQPYEYVPQYINLATVCINPFLITGATEDILPSKIVQYLACGKAVVATPLPGMLDLIPAKEAGVVYASTADEMTKEVISLVTSPERRQHTSQAGINFIKDVYSPDSITSRLESIISEAIKVKRET